jgi:hypothetical protein
LGQQIRFNEHELDKILGRKKNFQAFGEVRTGLRNTEARTATAGTAKSEPPSMSYNTTIDQRNAADWRRRAHRLKPANRVRLFPAARPGDSPFDRKCQNPEDGALGFERVGGGRWGQALALAAGVASREKCCHVKEDGLFIEDKVLFAKYWISRSEIGGYL